MPKNNYRCTVRKYRRIGLAKVCLVTIRESKQRERLIVQKAASIALATIITYTGARAAIIAQGTALSNAGAS